MKEFRGSYQKSEKVVYGLSSHMRVTTPGAANRSSVNQKSGEKIICARWQAGSVKCQQNSRATALWEETVVKGRRVGIARDGKIVHLAFQTQRVKIAMST